MLLRFSPAMAKDELASACSFDFLFYRNFPHILEMIFLSLDYESYKSCAEVSNEWKALLSSERYKSKGKTLFKQETQNKIANNEKAHTILIFPFYYKQINSLLRARKKVNYYYYCYLPKIQARNKDSPYLHGSFL